MAREKLQLAEKSNDELQAELAGMENDFLQLKFDHAIKGLPNPMDIRFLRRDIARVKTEMRKRELAAMTPEELSMRSKIRSRRRRN
jgi:large subunit ribosomal protein L29